MDQIGMPNAPDWDAVILASCLQAGPAGDPPCYRSPWQPGTAILLAHLRILMESPALVHQGYQGLSTKANVTLGSLPTQQRLAERGCSCPLSIPQVPQTPSASSPAQSGCCTTCSWCSEILLADSIIGKTEVPLYRSTKTDRVC